MLRNGPLVPFGLKGIVGDWVAVTDEIISPASVIID